MLTASRGLTLSLGSAPELPRVDELQALYDAGVKPRRGELMMVAGRSGMQKSGFALWWAQKMNLPTLYLSGDMSLYQVSSRLAQSRLGLLEVEVEQAMKQGGRKAREIEAALNELNFVISTGPISYNKIDRELEAWVELNNSFPELIVVDNLMDVDGADSDYTAQMEVMQNLSSLKEETKATILVLHHASDKTLDAAQNPYDPPKRRDIKNGLGEKPELCLTVGFDPITSEYKIACVKQRMGPNDPQARKWTSMLCVPGQNRFEPWSTGRRLAG